MNHAASGSLLTIGGSDPGGGAGIQADLRAFDRLGFFGLSAVTAVTAQNTRAVIDFFPQDPQQVESQLLAVLEDFQPLASKTGMLASPQTAAVVAGFAGRGELGPLVVDPVLASSAGPELSSSPPELAVAIRDQLLPVCAAVTPNLAEAAALTGMAVDSLDDARAAARVLVDELGAGGACVTGGHLAGSPADAVYDGKAMHVLGGRRRGSGQLHGTGCLYSAALTAALAGGESLAGAARFAKALVEKAIAQSVAPGGGMAIPWP